MTAGPVHDETARLAALRATGLLDSLPEESFDRFVRLAAHLLGMPSAAVSLVDDHRQFFKSAVGLAEPWASLRETPLSHSFCKHVVATRAPLIVTDARADARVAQNLAITELGVISYAGAPIVVGPHVLGAFCVLGTEPRAFSEADVGVLRDLAAAVAAEAELRTRTRALDESEQRYRLVSAHLENRSILLYDRDLRFEMADGERLLAAVGVPARELLGRTLYELAPAEHIALLEPSYRAVFEGRSGAIDLVVGDRTLHVTLDPIRDGDGTVLRGLAILTDVTKTQLAERELREQKELLASVLDNLAEVVVVTDLAAKEIVRNAAGRQVLGPNNAAPETWEPPYGVYTADGLTRFATGRAPLGRALAGQRTATEILLRAPHREPRAYAVTAGPFLDEAGVPRGAILVARDVTDAKRAEQELELERRFLRLLAHVTTEVNLATTWEAAARACLRELCAQREGVVGHVLAQTDGDVALTSTDVWCGQAERAFAFVTSATEGLRVTADDGSLVGRVMATAIPAWQRLADATDARGRAVGAAGLAIAFAFPVVIGAEVVAVFELFFASEEAVEHRLERVVSGIAAQLARVWERERHARALAALSLRDELTGLHNRRGFLMLGEQAIKAAHRAGRTLPLFFLDLDGLKKINDTLGHKAGDSAIVEAANVLRATFREADIVARLGGDEFVVLAPDALEGPLTQRLERTIASFNALPNREFALSMSVGVTVYDPQQPETFDALLARADAAMYERKRARRVHRDAARPTTLVPRSEVVPVLSYDALARLQQLTAKLTGVATRSEIASVALRECLHLLGARAASFRLLDENGDLQLLASAGYGERPPARIMPSATRVPITDAARDRIPVFLGSARAIADDYPEISGVPQVQGDGAWAALPLLDGDHCFGAIALSFSGPRAFVPDERAFLVAAVGQLAQAFVRAEDARAPSSTRAFVSG